MPLGSTSAIPSDAKALATVCVLCSQNCGIRVDVEGGRIAKIRPDKENPFSKGYTCNKAYRVGYYVQHAQRLQEPWKRQPDGSYAPISWDQAITEIGDKLARILDEHGPSAYAALGIGGQGNHLSFLYALALHAGTGSSWWFNALAQEKTQRALTDGWMTDSPFDVMLVGHIEESDYAVVLGSNLAISQRGPEPRRVLRSFEQDEERTLVVVDPRFTETARSADLHLPIKPGADVYFLLGMAAIIVREGLYDEGFVKTRTRGLEDVSAALEGVDPVAMAALCELPPEQLFEVARGFAAAERGGLEMDLGVEQSRFNTLTAYLLRLILALTDNLGRPGGAVFVGTLMPRIPGLKVKRPIAPVSGIHGVTLLAPTPMFSPSLFAEEVLRDDPGRIRAVIVEGSNPMLTYAETPTVREAFEQLELSVVIEPTWTETARVADYVLPTPVGYEKWEYAGFPKPFPLLGAQVRPPVVTGPPGALPEAEIYHRIALSMGMVVPAPGVLASLAKQAHHGVGALLYLAVLMPLALWKARGLTRLGAMVLFWIYETLGPTLKAPQLIALWLVCQGVAFTRRREVARAQPELARTWNRATLGNRLYREVMEHPEGAILAKTDPERNLEDHLRTPDGRIRLAPAPMMGEIGRALSTELSTELSEDSEHPFVLNGGMRTQWTANTNFRDPAWRKGRGPHCAVRMNSEDGVRLGFSDGELVRVRSRKGAVELPVKLEEGVRSGHLHIPNGFGTHHPDPETGELRATGVSINELTDAQDRDPFTGCPHFKFVRCSVEALPA